MKTTDSETHAISSIAGGNSKYCRFSNTPCKQLFTLTSGASLGSDDKAQETSYGLTSKGMLPLLSRMALTVRGRGCLHCALKCLQNVPFCPLWQWHCIQEMFATKMTCCLFSVQIIQIDCQMKRTGKWLLSPIHSTSSMLFSFQSQVSSCHVLWEHS